MIYHRKSVARGARKDAGGPFLLGDLPLGTHEISPEQVAEVDGVKLEGGKDMVGQVAATTKAGIAVIWYIRLTPQGALSTMDQDIDSVQSSANIKLSFGSTAASETIVLEDALALQEAGAVAIVLEAVTPEAA
ncbi:cell wall biogenesis and architecture protein [Exophiala xenobiotica]|uniref:3-methyl-2-oxobutanoate hydroxymethyltransferase n=1 Tax=Lithohypha guttulata TaxID=1690604 RepID=A0ABR0JZL2_9EURO|nr:cell wall biogenesis and architecture protein [Lithohypha guttulata]KAK5310296.1 cell wall biogenesis and architecture protein [Exophiala xenobiotica]